MLDMGPLSFGELGAALSFFQKMLKGRNLNMSFQEPHLLPEEGVSSLQKPPLCGLTNHSHCRNHGLCISCHHVPWPGEI